MRGTSADAPVESALGLGGELRQVIDTKGSQSRTALLIDVTGTDQVISIT